MGIEVALPGTILLLSFILKLVVDRTADVPALVASLCELPVDIALLATALIAAFTIGHADQLKAGMLSFILYIVAAICVVFFWRRSVRLFENERPIGCFLLAALSYALSGWQLVHAVLLLSPATK